MGGYTTLVTTGIGMLKARQQVKTQNAAIAANQQQQSQRLQYAQGLRERQQREQLRRDQATQRVRFAAGGVSPTGGSAQALLNGLAGEAEQNIRSQRTKNRFQIDDLGTAATTRRRANLLEYRGKSLNTGINMLGRLTSLLEK